MPVSFFALLSLVFRPQAATIVSGALAERTRFLAYALVSMIITAFIYPVVVHWTWGGGWLAEGGYVDFAGSGIVHMVGGVCALMGAAMVGPRQGRFEDRESASCCCCIKQTENSFRPHNVPMVVLGTLILWFGWYGFNCGSTLAAAGTAIDLAGVVALNTSLAAGVAGITALFTQAAISKFSKDRTTHYDISTTANGILAGLVSITAGCGDVTDYGAFILGLVGGLLYVLVSFAVRSMGVDDPLDAFAIHGACGAWGVFAVGFFHTSDGVFYGGDGTLLGWQVAGILAIFVWSAGLSALFFGILKGGGCLRMSAVAEREGADVHEHGGSAYTMKSQVTAIQMTPMQGDGSADDDEDDGERQPLTAGKAENVEPQAETAAEANGLKAEAAGEEV